MAVAVKACGSKLRLAPWRMCYWIGMRFTMMILVHGEVYLVTCGNIGMSVVTLDLQGNKLTGQITDEIRNCVSLKLLDLSLEGYVPFSISKLKHLELLLAGASF
ncbi:ERECTA-like 2 [Perilla frutescens var. hirtella]|nr:ERECTA-like 2 [Perilla frutescens var. hirtella]